MILSDVDRDEGRRLVRNGGLMVGAHWLIFSMVTLMMRFRPLLMVSWDVLCVLCKVND